MHTGLDQESPPKNGTERLLTQIVTGFMDYLIRSSISADRVCPDRILPRGPPIMIFFTING